MAAVAAVAIAVPVAVHFDRGGLGHISSADLAWQKGCIFVDENTATATLRYGGMPEGGAVSIGATVTVVDAKTGATGGFKTVRATVRDGFDVRLPVTVSSDESRVTGTTTCYMSMARHGWHWPGH